MIIASLIDFLESANRLSQLLGAGLILIEKRIFPDGEILIKVKNPEKLKNENIVLFHKMYPDQNTRIIELIQILDVLQDYGASRVFLVIPYMPYARQDKRFLKGECISLKALLNVIAEFNVEKLLTVDVHNENFLKSYAKFEVQNISALESITKHVAENQFAEQDFMIVSPDVGGIKRVKKVAESLGLNYTFIEKERDRITGEVKFKEISPDKISGNVLVLDDIIATGGTIVGAGFVLKRAGVKRMIVGATHLQLLKDADKRIISAGYECIVGTNTIDSPYSFISIEPLLSRAILKEG